MEPGSGRRDYDRDIDPAIENWVENRLRADRHANVNEFRALRVKIEDMQLTSTKEHGAVTSLLADLVTKVEKLTKLEERVTSLETAEKVERAEQVTRDNLRKQSRTQFYTLVGLIVAAVPSAAVIANHIH